MSQQTARVQNRQAGWYCIQQHDQFEVRESSGPPDLSIKDHERAKRAFGPYRTRAEAQKRADDEYSRTLTGLIEGQG